MSKINFNFDKKQMPQVLVLGILSVILIGYFASKMLTPPPAERATAATLTVATEKQKPVVTPIDTPSDDLCNGLAPSPTMHDPFVVAASDSLVTNPIPAINLHPDNPVQQSDPHIGPLQPMPFESGVKPLAQLGPTPSTLGSESSSGPGWAVTGVICGSTPGDGIAILRNGESRRFVALGHMVDDQYRLIGVDRMGVTLAQGKTRLRLTLGSASTKDALTKPTGGANSSETAGSTLSAVTSSQTRMQNTDSSSAGSVDTLPELKSIESDATAQN